MKMKGTTSLNVSSLIKRPFKGRRQTKWSIKDGKKREKNKGGEERVIVIHARKRTERERERERERESFISSEYDSDESLTASFAHF